jgi:hypothetical protein
MATVSDDFNRADNTDINVGAPVTYATIVGTLRIISNALCRNTLGPRCRAESDLASADHFCEAVVSVLVTSGANAAEVYVRYDSAADTAYGLVWLGATGGLRVRKIVAGVATDLGTGTTQTVSLPATIRLEVSGTTLTVKFNGATVESFTDASIAGGVRVGLGLGNAADGSSAIDSFNGGDLAAAGNNPKGPLSNPFMGPFGGAI